MWLLTLLWDPNPNKKILLHKEGPAHGVQLFSSIGRVLGQSACPLDAKPIVCTKVDTLGVVKLELWFGPPLWGL